MKVSYKGRKQKGTRRENQLRDLFTTMCQGLSALRAPMSRGHLIGEHDNVDLLLEKGERKIRVQSKAKPKLPGWLNMEGVDTVVITVDGAGSKPAERYALIRFDLLTETINHDLL